jgi:ketosteroid isomerase-like protein
MPNKEFWAWQTKSHLCSQCKEEPNDCMRCEIVWEAAQESAEAAKREGAAAAPCLRDHQQLSIDMPFANKCSCGVPLR